jgi:hypothetical protein
VTETDTTASNKFCTAGSDGALATGGSTNTDAALSDDSGGFAASARGIDRLISTGSEGLILVDMFDMSGVVTELASIGIATLIAGTTATTGRSVAGIAAGMALGSMMGSVVEFGERKGSPTAGSGASFTSIARSDLPACDGRTTVACRIEEPARNEVSGLDDWLVGVDTAGVSVTGFDCAGVDSVVGVGDAGIDGAGVDSVVGVGEAGIDGAEVSVTGFDGASVNDVGADTAGSATGATADIAGVDTGTGSTGDGSPEATESETGATASVACVRSRAKAADPSSEGWAPTPWAPMATVGRLVATLVVVIVR